jgi:hypothetical protein
VMERAALIGDAAHPFQPCVYRLTVDSCYFADYIL